MMGSEADRDARPVHQVTISKPFYLGATEVTFAQYDAFLEAIGNLRDPPADQRWGRSNWPVINVSWFEARAYAEWFGAMIGASCRLPSEAEWEYACRAGSTTEYAFGRTLDTAEANFAGAVRKTTQVCSYPANNWSLYDMHGNVWEWAEDCYHETYYDRMKGQARPPASSDRCPHVLRGGSWNNNQQDVSCAKRDGIPPSQKTDKIGFRVLCSKRLDGEPCTTAHSPDAGAAYIPR